MKNTRGLRDRRPQRCWSSGGGALSSRAAAKSAERPSARTRSEGALLEGRTKSEARSEIGLSEPARRRQRKYCWPPN
jgi:hypothetical protein